MKRGMILMITVSRRAWGAPLEEAANGWETWEWERAASWTFSWAEPHRRPTKTFPGINVLFSFKMFVSERKRSAQDKIRRCLVSPLPRSLFIGDHQIYHSFSFWWQSKQIYHLCHQNPICLNTTLSHSLWRVLLSQLNVFNLQSGEVLATF